MLTRTGEVITSPVFYGLYVCMLNAALRYDGSLLLVVVSIVMVLFSCDTDVMFVGAFIRLSLPPTPFVLFITAFFASDRVVSTSPSV